eukprot:4891378-Pyramimonas_sp.AAC.1
MSCTSAQWNAVMPCRTSLHVGATAKSRSPQPRCRFSLLDLSLPFACVIDKLWSITLLAFGAEG